MSRLIFLITWGVVGLGACSEDDPPDLQDAGVRDGDILEVEDMGALADLGVEDVGGPANGCQPTGEACPDFRLVLGVECQQDTTGAFDRIFDPRLEFGGDGDHLLAFVAPADGDYLIDFEPPNGSDACGISVFDSSGQPHSPQTDCPPSALQTTDLDGVYYSGEPIPLQSGEEIMFGVGCPSWAMNREGPYSMTVRSL